MSDPIAADVSPESTTETETDLPPRTNGHWPLGWAVFLGCSWTWCIGMFLPVLLVRDYGLWGWVVFAVPNVIGAAAMGWMLRTRERSDALVASHSAAVYAFSLVTVAFHIFFVVFILHRWIFYEAVTYVWVILLAAAIFAIGRRRGAMDLVMGVIVFAVSAGAMIAFIGTAGASLPPATGRRPTADVWPLAAACVFGFALCPYLDGTFHRARAATSTGGARVAFGAGFGLFFLAMIVFTLLYAPPLARALRGKDPLPAGAVIAIAVHMVAQCAYTIAVHLRQPRSLVHFVAGASFFAFTLTFIGWHVVRWTRLPADEVVYRLFMSFYGLVFPAYVWLCMLPSWRDPRPPTRRSLAVFGSAVVLAAPMFAVAFLGHRMMWLVPGLLIVLAARIAIRPKLPESR